MYFRGRIMIEKIKEYIKRIILGEKVSSEKYVE